MYTGGGDSAESQNYTQWALNPSTYQNMANDQVDWAALAQQWIIMKEAGPPMPEQVASAPPAPVIGKACKEFLNKGGEAPMDVESDGGQWSDPNSGDSFVWNQVSVPPPPSIQPSWGWNNAWSNTPPNVPPPTSIKGPLLPTPGYTTYSPTKDNDNSNFAYNSGPSTNPGYWTSAGTSKIIKPHNKRYSKVNVPVPTKAPPPMVLDANKRKKLPAWIREGLEKMERDKLKQIDRTREKVETDDAEEKNRLREDAMEILKSSVKINENKKLSAYDDDEVSDDSVQSSPRSPPPQTYEEKMLKVRKVMTEILLKVTNREIQNICREELQRHVRKLKATDHRVSAPTGANLSAKLGLGVYEGSGDSSAESETEENDTYHDSDSELKDIIRRRKEEFLKVEKDIEDRLAEANKDDHKSRSSSPDSDSQVEARKQESKLRRSDERTPPPKNSTQTSTSRKRYSSHSSFSNSDSDDKSSRSKRRSCRSSSSDRARNARRSKITKHKRYSSYKRSRSRDKRSHSRDRRSRSKDRRSRSKERRSRSKDTSSRSKDRRSRSRSSRRDSYRDYRYRKASRYSRSRSRSRSYRRQDIRSRSRRSNSSSYRSSKRSPSRSRSCSSRRHRKSRSHSNGRGKRSHRH